MRIIFCTSNPNLCHLYACTTVCQPCQVLKNGSIYSARLPHSWLKMGEFHGELLQVAELASLAQLLPPCSPTVRNPAPDSSLRPGFSCCSRTRLRHPLPLLLPVCLRLASSCCSRTRLRHPLPLLLPVCLRLASSCCSPIAPASAACCSPPDHVRFDCCSPIASA